MCTAAHNLRKFTRSGRASASILTLTAAAACSESVVAVRPPAESRLAVAPTVTAQEHAAVLARAFATALSDPTLRRAVRSHLASSRATAEHKLNLSAYARGAGQGLIARAASASGVSAQRLQAAMSALPVVEFYMPVAAHRDRWTGAEDVLVAASMTPNVVVAYDSRGNEVPVSAENAPDRPTLVLVPSETDFDRVVPAGVANAARVPGAIGTLQTEYQRILHPSAKGASRLVACEPPECGGGGGPITIDRPLGPAPTSTGLFLRQMQIWDKAEPWTRGDPEIEVQVLGTQPDFYFITGQNIQGYGGTLAYSSNTKLTPFACAGAQGSVPAAKRFDYNGEGGAVYSNTVLLAGVGEFAVRERVQGQQPYLPGPVLKDRKVSLRPPFIIDVWERDDGAECPSPAMPYVAAGFTVGIGYEFNPAGGYRNWKPSLTTDDWKRLFGIIENANDHMGRWQFSTWDEFEGLNANSVYTSGYVYVKFTNNGVNRNNVPAPQDPFVSF